MPDSSIIITGAGVAATVSLVLGYIVLEARKDKERKRRFDMFVHRVAMASDTRDLRAEIQRKKVSNRLKSLEEQKKHSKSRLGAVSSLIAQAGIDMSVTKFWMICICMGLLSAGFCVLQRMPVFVGPIAGFMFTFVLPKFFLRFLANKRAKEFTKYFVGAIDIITRGLKSGLPPQECFRIIAKDVPDPCGKIFRQIIDETNAGLSTNEAMERAYRRMPTQEFMFFCTVISVQDQTGGNLADILGNISMVLRGRAQLREKVKAMAGEARASSMIVGILPFAVAGILYVINYDYISLLWLTRIGQYFLGGAAVMMFTGIFTMNKLGKLDM